MNAKTASDDQHFVKRSQRSYKEDIRILTQLSFESQLFSVKRTVQICSHDIVHRHSLVTAYISWQTWDTVIQHTKVQLSMFVVELVEVMGRVEMAMRLGAHHYYSQIVNGVVSDCLQIKDYQQCLTPCYNWMDSKCPADTHQLITAEPVLHLHHHLVTVDTTEMEVYTPW